MESKSAELLEGYMENSKCATDKERLYLLGILGHKNVRTSIRYRASEHGWNSDEFHKRCDGLGPTITLCKDGRGECIGGFTKA